MRVRQLLMRTCFISLLCLAGVALLAEGVEAKKVVRFGSIEFKVNGGTTLVGMVVTMNPGLEKTIPYQIPPLTGTTATFTTPFLFDVDDDDDDGKPERKSLDSLIVLTNSGTGTLTIDLKFYDAQGTLLTVKGGGTVYTVTLDAHETETRFASDLLQW
ncbi:MAG: hypothetical protein HZA23_01430 [Nitrospirae bacterium]|nr:hypothetical protein [Nitrospirota bacterium]